MGNTNDERTELVFQSDAFDLGWDNSDPSSAIPVGRDVAIFFSSKLSQIGAVMTTVPEASLDPEGWYWFATVKDERYHFSANWIEWGDPTMEGWAVGVGRVHSFWRSRFGKPTDWTERAPAVALLKHIVENEPCFRNVKWLTIDEFNRLNTGE